MDSKKLCGMDPHVRKRGRSFQKVNKKGEKLHIQWRESPAGGAPRHSLRPNLVYSPGKISRQFHQLWSRLSFSTSWVIRWAPRLPLSEPCPAPLCSHPGCSVGPPLTVSCLKQQHPNAHQGQSSQTEPDEILHCVVLEVGGYKMWRQKSPWSGRPKSPQDPGCPL